MSVSLLVVAGVLVAVFVGVNVGGSSTGVAFGPAVGSGVLSMRRAAALMAGFVLLGGLAVGTRVVDTLGTEFVPPAVFTIEVSLGVLLFTGLSILVGNALKVSVSTSETAVGAIVGTGAALGVLDWNVVGGVVLWWFVSVVVAFWVAAVIGRYVYAPLCARVDLEAGRRGVVSRLAVVALGCYMAFTAGASNTASAVAPLVGAGQLDMVPAVLLGGIAIGLGAFLLGHRTVETIGEGITPLTIEATLLVETVAASVVTALSWAGVPASLAITLTTCVIGLGWGRASRHTEPVTHPATTRVDSAGETETSVVTACNGGVDWADSFGCDGDRSCEGGATRSPARESEPGAGDTDAESPAAGDPAKLYDRATVATIVATWIVTPTLSAGLAYAAFRVALDANLL